MTDVVMLLLYIAIGASVGALIAIARSLGRIARALERGEAQPRAASSALPTGRRITDESSTLEDSLAARERDPTAR